VGPGVVVLPNLFNQRKINESHMMASVGLQPTTNLMSIKRVIWSPKTVLIVV
jgi:hypothetical protein